MMAYNKILEPEKLRERREAKWKRTDDSLHIASRDGNIEAVKDYLAAGSDVNAEIKNGLAPLQFAVANDQKEIAELLIAAGADLNTKNVNGTAPLHLAARIGHKKIVELLIDKGADMNAKADSIEFTPLHIAAREGHKEIVELLIAKGADVNVLDAGGYTPLDLAKNNPEITDLLRKHGGKTAEELKAEGN